MSTAEIEEDPLLHEPLSLGELDLFRERLQTLLESLQDEEATADEAGLQPSGGERYQEDDEPVEESALAVELGALDTTEELGYAVREALQRIRDGTFGTCSSCGEWISRGRLRLVPYARTCRACAAR